MADSKNTPAAPAATEWETIVAPSGTKVILDEIGDEFIGRFTGMQHIVPEDKSKDEFDQVGFTGVSLNGTKVDPEPYALPASYKLTRAFDNVPEGTLCRLTLKGKVPIAGQPSPMKDIQVDKARG
jgi:hypothetical protein